MLKKVEGNGKKRYEDYEVKSAMEDLMRAEEHKQDPELMKHVSKHVKKKKKAIMSIDDLRARAKEVNRER